MYPYHAIIKQRIRNGELADVQETDNYRNIGPCKLLIFKTDPIIRPIRPHRYAEYDDILLNFYERKLPESIT